MKMLVILLVAIMAISAPAFAAEFLTNGGFEDPADFVLPGGNASANGVKPVSGWTLFNVSSQTTDPLGLNVTTNSGACYDGITSITMNPIGGIGTRSLYMSARGANGAGGYMGLYQTKTLAAGTYTLSALINLKSQGTLSGNDWAGAQIGIFSGVWNAAIFPAYSLPVQYIPQIPVSGADTALKWGWAVKSTAFPLNSTGPVNSGGLNLTAGNWTVFIELGTNCDTVPTTKNRLKMMVDNVSLDGIVPEPGSMVAVFTGIVGLIGFGIRRKR